MVIPEMVERLTRLEARFEGCGIDHEDKCAFDHLLKDCVEACGLEPAPKDGWQYGGAAVRDAIKAMREELDLHSAEDRTIAEAAMKRKELLGCIVNSHGLRRCECTACVRTRLHVTGKDRKEA